MKTWLIIAVIQTTLNLSLKKKIIIHNCLSCMHNCHDQPCLQSFSAVQIYVLTIILYFLKITCSRTKWQHNVNTSFTLFAILKSYLRNLPCKISFRYFAITSCCLTLQWFSMDNISGYLKEKLQKKSHMNLCCLWKQRKLRLKHFSH